MSIPSRLQVLGGHIGSGSTSQAAVTKAPPVVVGGMVLDIQASPTTAADVQRGGSVPGRVQQVAGGVGRNIAHALALICRGWSSPLLVSVVGDDVAADALLADWQALGCTASGITRCKGVATPTSCIVFDRGGEVAACVVDVAAVEQCLTAQVLRSFQPVIAAAPLLLIDGNLGPEAMQAACSMAAAAGVPVWFEPVSVPKAVRAATVLHLLDYISPNARELLALSAVVRQAKHLAPLPQTAELVERIESGAHARPRSITADLAPHLLTVLQAGVGRVVLTLGPQGAAMCSLTANAAEVSVSHMQALPASVANCSGAGDCLVAGAVAALLRCMSPIEALAHGMGAAKCAVEAVQNVPPGLSQEAVRKGAAAALETLQTWEHRQ